MIGIFYLTAAFLSMLLAATGMTCLCAGGRRLVGVSLTILGALLTLVFLGLLAGVLEGVL